ncbi:MAG: UDP-N-acetylmuramoyl-L-alanyl-D-glutamate--2,6-diaminopimelate ligase [Hydrogenophilales bacterium 28-61-23]|nr:MAG: UDP-N-acetylmuramoyl-L-alanyl-D-glutamate--2,6-diaminopimelate ligase [Hydrogenophilales bacterium 28-61-23]
MNNAMASARELVAILRGLAPTARGIGADSRLIGPDDIFLAYPGAAHDGRSHIASAIHAGAAAIAWEPEGFAWQEEWRSPHLPVANLKARAAALAAAWYGQPSESLWMTGITGTNGKTSVAQWLAASFTGLGRKTAAIGTLGNGFPGQLVTASHTTPDAVSLQALLAEYRDMGAAGVAMEVSSHGLDQGRVEGVAFDVAVFTNLSRDHLDYHGDMASYAAAKARLFQWPGLKAAVLNADDELGAALVEQLKTGPAQVLSYGLKSGDLRAEHCHADRLGLRLDIASPWGRGELVSPLLGEFNAYNLLAVLGALLVSDVPMAAALSALEQLRPVAGRMQRVETELGADPDVPTVIVDFAHTPDALDKVLTALKPLTTGRLICVFGCGGGRDTGKRPLMGAAVAAHADQAIVTSDNPRNEDPAQIVAGILAGMPPPSDETTSPPTRLPKDVSQVSGCPPAPLMEPPADRLGCPETSAKSPAVPLAGEGSGKSRCATCTVSVMLDRRAAIGAAILNAAPEDIVVLAGKGHEDYQEIHGVKHPFSDLAEARLALAARSANQTRNSHASA